MTKRTKIGLLTIIILLLLLLLWWLFLRPSGPSADVGEIKQGEAIPRPEQVDDRVDTLPLFFDDDAAVNETSIQSLAKGFVERYGSFSSESDFANIKDVLVLMSSDYRVQTERSLETLRASDGLYGVSTRVLSVDVLDAVDETTTRVRADVSTQREETIDTVHNTSIKYQTIVLGLVKEAGVWKVDSALWQD